MNVNAPVVAHDRLERVLAHTGYVLKELRHTARAGALSGDLALIWRRHLGPVELCLLLATAAQAANPEDLDTLMTAKRDREPLTDFGRKHRPPPLTAIEKRRAAQIPDFDDPDFLAKLGAGTTDRDRRARLASAWNGASNRDRRDLISRATARAS